MHSMKEIGTVSRNVIQSGAVGPAEPIRAIRRHYVTAT